MFNRIIRFIFLTFILGSSAIFFTNAGLQTSVNALEEDYYLHAQQGLKLDLDVELITALIFLLTILGFAIIILIDFLTTLRRQIFNVSGTFGFHISTNSSIF